MFCGIYFKEIKGSFHVQKCADGWYNIVTISSFSGFTLVLSLFCFFLHLPSLLHDPSSCSEHCLIHSNENKEIETFLGRSGKGDERKPRHDKTKEIRFEK